MTLTQAVVKLKSSICICNSTFSETNNGTFRGSPSLFIKIIIMPNVIQTLKPILKACVRVGHRVVCKYNINLLDMLRYTVNQNTLLL